MAVVTTKSQAITNRDATPKVINDARVTKGDLVEAVDVAELANGDSIGSKIILCSVPSNARISQVLLSCDAISTTGAADVGLYDTTENGGDAVDADFFASAQDLTSGLTNNDVT